jgi:hypothetical protein
MGTSLLVLHVRRRRDLLLARERARQVARLLGFDAVDQACIAAGVFEIACQAMLQSGCCGLQFQTDGNTFQVFPIAGTESAQPGQVGGLRLEKPLPTKEPPVGQEDVAWVVQQLAQLTAPDAFAEIKQQNQEVLFVLAELQACRSKLAAALRESTRPAA